MEKAKTSRITFLLAFIFVFLFSLMVTAGAASAGESAAEVRLNIQTYLDGKNQPTHPSVIAFSEPWHGYRYWMAYTPYPYGNGAEENPSICASNDMLYWETPDGLANPIATNEETECNELKDSHLLYRDDLDRLEVWYLGRLSERLGGDGKSLTLFRKYSYDGIIWSNFEVMAIIGCVSPSVIWDGTKYQLWTIDYDGKRTTFAPTYWESEDGFQWSAPTKCSLEGNPEDFIWHGAVSNGPNGYEFVYIISGDMQKVMYCTSEDGIHFSEPTPIVLNDQKQWRQLYRPAMVWANETCYCFYGVINEANQWYISMSHGNTPFSLEGITEADTDAMFPLANDVTATGSITYKIKAFMQTFRYYFRLELFAIIVFEFFVLLFRPIRCMKIWDTYLPYIGHSMLAFIYTSILMRPVKAIEWAYITLASTVIGFLISASADAVRHRLEQTKQR